jgi:hypothetical protein
MRRKSLNSLCRFFLIILVSFPVSSVAGKINNISFDNSILTIHHTGCIPKRPYKEKTKFIIRMGNCASGGGLLNNFSHPNLKKIHWAQHDPETVWIVATLKSRYILESQSFPYQYLVCLPSCKPQTQQKSLLSEIRVSNKMMFMLNDLLFQIPLEDIRIDEFLDRSIGFIPKDMIRDGLPHFGAKRDDWLGKPRKHLGYDIYVNQTNVLAAADGRVSKVRTSRMAGLYVKLHHGHRLYTLYVHLKKANVKMGQKVRRGDVIGKIDGPVGNAIAPQLHFEVKPNNRSIDPLPLIENFYQDDQQIMEKIKNYKKLLSKLIRKRDQEVKKFLK